MAVVLLLARLLLASVFVVAGAAKLVDREGSRRAIADFGLPAPLAVLLPLAELAVAAALLPASTAFSGAAAALALLLLFTAAIGVNLARGRTAECHCFGQLHSAPAGWRSLARNGLLAATAGFVLWQGHDGAGPSAVAWLAGLSAAQIAGLVLAPAVLAVLAAQSWVLLNALRQNGRLLMRVEALERRLGAAGAAPASNGVEAPSPLGLPIGDAAPEFALADLHGERLTLESLRSAGRPVMLLFTDPDCGPCTAMLPEISRWQKEHAERLTISLVSRGTVQENRAKSTEHGLRGVLMQEDWEVSAAYGVESTPSAVLVRTDGAIGSRVVEGASGISALLAYALEEHVLTHRGAERATRAAPKGSRAAEPAPELVQGA